MRKTGIILFLIITIAAGAVCQAEEPLFSSQTGHPGDDRPLLPDYLPEKPGKGLILPPTPVAPGSVAGGRAFELKGIAFEGNTIFSDQELLKAAHPFVGNKVSIADLEELRYRITRQYVDRGYINSGAVLKPDQEVDDGVVTYLIMEGQLNGVEVSGNGRLREDYIEKRIWPDKKTPFKRFRPSGAFSDAAPGPAHRKNERSYSAGSFTGRGVSGS